MYRNSANEPKPANLEQMRAAIDEVDMIPFLSQVVIYSPDPDNSAPYHGWCAEMRGTDEESSNSIETAGFDTRLALLSALVHCGFVQFKDENGKWCTPPTVN